MCRSEQSQVIVVVDPMSTGATVAAEAASRGYAVIAVWDKEISEDAKLHVPKCVHSFEYHAEVQEKATLQETAAAVRAASSGFELLACIVGAEVGVALADALSLELGLRSNGICAARRDKKVQQELVRDAGLRSVRQAGGKTWSDVKAFVESESMPVVVKPTESAGSDGVKLCSSVKEAEEHFHLLMNSQRQFGSQDASVLCQEFLKGKEYVVDHVSRDGEHKTVQIWVYDKRPANGSAFVYYGMLPVPAESEIGRQLIPYVRGVLDALGIRNGPSHGEVMMTATGPCLVEMNCRAHGGDGSWAPLAKALTGGYCQVDASLDAFTDADAFKSLPEQPPSPFLASGQVVMLVSHVEGEISGVPGFERIRQMESFVSMESLCKVGCVVVPTVDLFSSPGSVILMHHDPEVVQRDIAEIRQMEECCTTFDFTAHEILCRPRALSWAK